MVRGCGDFGGVQRGKLSAEGVCDGFVAYPLQPSQAGRQASDPPGDLGSGLIDYSQKMTVAAMQIADMKVCAHRS